jgi:hypothetical protein
MSGNHLRRNDAQFCVYPEYLSDILYESSHNPELFVLMEATKPDAGRKSVGSGGGGRRDVASSPGFAAGAKVKARGGPNFSGSCL